MRLLTGRDPSTGELTRAHWDADGVIVQIERLGTGGGEPWLAPGLIDLQVNGYRGHDVNAADVDAGTIASITSDLAATGVTSWVPTIITNSEDAILRALTAVATARRVDAVVAAAIPFAHVEGPFVSDQDGPRGVQDPAFIRPVDAAEVERWTKAGPVGYVTVSPHWPGSPEQIRAITALGVAVSIGHTHATTEQIRAAVDAGATLSTHLGNGIAATLPRHPNAIWTQLADDRLTCGLVGDGHHLPAETLTAMVRAKGPGRAFLVSDATELAGQAPGRYRTSVGGDVELSESGRLSYVGTELLAGAATDLAFNFGFVLGHTPLSMRACCELACATPGRIVQRLGGRRCGELVTGSLADLVLLDDRGRVLQVVQSGRVL
ncbi:N-acetylglucosamine-6-phosphate deacetylase [Brooklawnia cerclae]|uniref:N-acetylglucosamine-6-phosphate deacetylase n=1 Tax=Brooklawnia cerclae TaxID=349934 RepID=A0ABX0SIV6_9ACTN|nr:amidohydrolase family protein [Brooklawnia cerclae]NIH57910.1 N-acetylglucosamine-6-phosphate deacetylase [Brooklawnia cerclae]